MNINAIQDYLKEHELDGWLLADFHGRNEIGMRFLEISGMLTRRFFYYIPSSGDPTGLVSIIETAKFKHLPGRLIEFRGYRELEAELDKLLSGRKRVAMEYSENGRLPYIGLVDSGTIDLVRKLGLEIVSSADLVASFQARLSPQQIASHRVAAHNLIEIKSLTFDHIAENLGQGKDITEYDCHRFILDKFAEYDMVTDDGPICAVNDHAGDPHFEPTPENSRKIAKGDLILVDMWAKLVGEHGVYADITWMAYAGERSEIPEKYTEIFQVLASARNAAIEFLRDNLDSRPVHGYEVDDVVRHSIENAGYGDYFTHRTGHSITDSVHGTGPNIDNLETADDRRLQQGHLFSIEPGIYMKDCGFRTEIDALISHEGCEVTTLPLQEEIYPLF